MWRLLNILFGWDYVYWVNTADRGVARVFNDGLGRAIYWRYRNTRVLDVIRSQEQVVWLTCKPSKYLQDVQQSTKETP